MKFISDIMSTITKNPSEILDPSETFLDTLKKRSKTQKKNDSEKQG